MTENLSRLLGAVPAVAAAAATPFYGLLPRS
jgi:hypothetical protein